MKLSKSKRTHKDWQHSGTVLLYTYYRDGYQVTLDSRERQKADEIINYPWMQPVNDTQAQEDLKKVFPDGKPSVEEFIEFVARMAKKIDDDLPFS